MHSNMLFSPVVDGFLEFHPIYVCHCCMYAAVQCCLVKRRIGKWEERGDGRFHAVFAIVFMYVSMYNCYVVVVGGQNYINI